MATSMHTAKDILLKPEHGWLDDGMNPDDEAMNPDQEPMNRDHERSQQGIEASLRLAIEFHLGQRDKAGDAYLLHLLRVMLAGSDAEAMQAGLLHDLLEDTPATLETMQRAGLSDTVIEAVALLTKPEAMAYSSYIVRLAGHPLASRVKRADLQDNYGLHRVAYRSGHAMEDGKRLQRYILAYQFLSGEIEQSEFLDRMRDVDSV